MKKIGLVITLSMVSTTALATPLWQGVSAGMSSKEVMAIFPRGDRSSKKIEIKKFQPTPGCDSDVTILLPNKRVTEVVVSGKDRKCASKIYTALIGKYGDPNNANENSNQRQSQGLGGAANSYVNRQVGNFASQQGLSGAGVGIATSIVGGLFGGGGDDSKKREAAWFNDGVMMRFEVDDEKWTMTYSPMDSLGL